ncbi:MAG: FAD synthase, partial [Nitrososphaeria archaeon]|nr:FAD synthase [Nitrososphaeria archaeon]
MDVIDKKILASMFACQFTKEDLIENIIKKTNLSESYISERIANLKKNLMVTENNTLTDFGRTTLHVVLAGGVFDIIHPGHIYTLNAAKALGDVLVVVIATGNTAVRMKKRHPLHSEEQRQELINSLQVVDLCLIGNDGDIFKTVSKVRPDIIALGYDQVHQEKFITDGCKNIDLNVRVARLQSP